MTPFLEFCLQYPSVIHLEQPSNQFWCGDVDAHLCYSCPNDGTPGTQCNTFLPQELDYLTSNHPELFI